MATGHRMLKGWKGAATATGAALFVLASVAFGGRVSASTVTTSPYILLGYQPGGLFGQCSSGEANCAGTSTGVIRTTGGGYAFTASGGATGIGGAGNATGVYGQANTAGVLGQGGKSGIEGTTGNSFGYGVYGHVTASSSSGVYGNNASTGDGVQGQANNGTGVRGLGGTDGVVGEGDTGVYGFGSSQNGVFAETAVTAASGVYGQNDAGGFGVAGRAVNGTGLFGDAAHGTGAWASTEDGTALKVTAGTGGTGITATAPGVALSVQGKAKFSRSGAATVAGTTAAPTNSVKVSLPITAKSMMTATLQTYVPGIFVVAAVPDLAGGSFTIYLNKQVSTSVGPVSWMVVERP